MARTAIVPTPKGITKGQTLILFGKTGLEFASTQDAVAWAESIFDTDEVVRALAILLAARKPTTRGKTLTIDTDATQIVRLT